MLKQKNQGRGMGTVGVRKNNFREGDYSLNERMALKKQQKNKEVMLKTLACPGKNMI